MSDFKRVYLGERKHRRKLVNPFKSNMIEIIHRLTSKDASRSPEKTMSRSLA